MLWASPRGIDLKADLYLPSGSEPFPDSVPARRWIDGSKPRAIAPPDRTHGFTWHGRIRRSLMLGVRRKCSSCTHGRLGDAIAPDAVLVTLCAPVSSSLAGRSL